MYNLNVKNIKCNIHDTLYIHRPTAILVRNQSMRIRNLDNVIAI